ncbi:unnamed protein product [Mytilus coruscus]|uniref:Uncharacterized protein n=1 Tax=Mytilus coruscus TaxID=42192 RepID=A0A6J8BC55_MYTCO|nr:unnamed protein product [Mytilus coruscus]
MADIDVEHLISNNDITLTSVYCDYPVTCLPTKFNVPSGPKGKHALTEEIDTHLYDEAAHMIAFCIPHPKLAPWIKSLSLLYYEHYGKSPEYVVSWFDDPENWSTKNSGNKSICVEISTKADVVNSLLYKITLFINTGLVQVQGNHKDNFVDKDFPVLVKLVNVIYMATNSDKSGSCKINTSQCGSETDLSDQTNIKQISTLIDTNNNKDLASHNDSIVTKDKFGQVHETNNISQSDMNVAHFQPDQIFSRMEASFTLALDKICTQQSDLFNSKFQLMEHYYNQSIETNNNNFKMLQDTITTILKPTSDNDELAARIVSLEKKISS